MDETNVISFPTGDEWQHVWGWMRRNNDWRLLPQQCSSENEEAVSLAEYQQIKQAWIAAGAPRYPQESKGA